MSSLADLIAAMLLWISSMALCQFGMAVDLQAKAPPKVERVIARTPPQHAVQSVQRCPHQRAAALDT